MTIWEIVDDEYFINIDNITFIDCSKKGEFTVGFIGGSSQSFTTDSSQKEFAQEIRAQFNATDFKEEGDEDIASSEELSKPEPAWRTVYQE